MLRTRTRAVIVGLILYIAYLAGINYYFQLEYSWIFLIAAGYYAFMFLVMTSDYKPQKEESSLTMKDKGIRIIPKDKFSAAAFGSIVLLLLAVTLPLATVVLNQTGIFHVAWYFQVFAAFGGAGLSYATMVPFSRRSYVPSVPGYDPRKDATKIVIDTLVEQLGVDRNDVTPNASIVNDLGADELDMAEITMQLDDVTERLYGYPVFSLIPRSDMKPELRAVLEIEKEFMSRQLNRKVNAEEIERHYRRIQQLLPTVNDYINVVSQGIYYIRTHS